MNRKLFGLGFYTQGCDTTDALGILHIVLRPLTRESL